MPIVNATYRKMGGKSVVALGNMHQFALDLRQVRVDLDEKQTSVVS